MDEVVADTVPDPLHPLNILQLNDFVLLHIFSYLTEFEKYFCSRVCVRFRTIALTTYADAIEFDNKLNKYFIPPPNGPNDKKENLDQCYAIFKALGTYWKRIKISHNFSILPVTSILKFVKKLCLNVEHLIVHFDNIESKYVLNNLPKKLKTISLSVACRCKGNWLNPLRDCVNVEHLTLKFAMKNKKNVFRGDFLQNFRNLKVLIFDDCRPTGLRKCLRNSTELSVLELNYDLVNTSNRLIGIILLKLTKLQRIKLQPIHSMRLDQLGLLRNLKYLTLDSYIPNDLNSLFRNLISINKVQCFELDNCQSLVHSEIISEIHNWTSLRYLHIDYMESFDDRFLRQLAKSGNLNYFHFSGRGRNVSVIEMINFMTKSIHLEVFDFHIYYESNDSFTPDTVSDVERLKEFQRSAIERIRIISIYNTAISVHCSGGFRVRMENTFQRPLATNLNLDLSNERLGQVLGV